jgi:RNA polymerase sigma factor (TIGR02999 family)
MPVESGGPPILGEPASQITTLLAAASGGDASACERLWGLVYDELHRMAQRQLADDGLRRMVQPTTLVHETYLRLCGSDGAVDLANRRQFFAAAARAMRRIRVDHARKRDRLKRGAGCAPRELPDSLAGRDVDPGEALALDEALAKLEAEAPRAAEVFSLRYFTGLSVDEVAKMLAVAPRTVEMDWRFGRAWLREQLDAR